MEGDSADENSAGHPNPGSDSRRRITTKREPEMPKVSQEVEERRVRFAALSERSGNCRMAADDVEEEIKEFQAGEERRGSCASQSNGCCFDPPMVEQVFACGAVHAEHCIKAVQEENIRRNGRRSRER